MQHDIKKILQELEILKAKYTALENERNKFAEQNKQLQQQVIELESQIQKLNESIDKKTTDDKQKHLRFKMVTVLFANIHGFNKLSQQQDAQHHIDQLDHFNFEFENILSKFNIERLKSIGDSIICAGGIPKKNRTNAIETVMAALEMMQYVKSFQNNNRATENIWNMSFGIHTGPVTAIPIVGKKRTTYEIKGDTVTIASRIQSSGDVGKIIISSVTHEFVQDYFRCEYLCKLPVKYEGTLAIYSVKGFRPEYSEDKEGFIPNNKFNIRFALIRYDDLEEYILDRLEKELPKHLYYHNLKHTIDVITQVELIGTGEGVSSEELLYLKTAALFHDMGHIISSKDHEYHGTCFTKEILPKYGYGDEQINIINNIILATKLPPQPKTLLEQIICDADLDYLGRADFIPVSDTLYKELNEQGLINSLNDWNKLQVKFLSAHQYFTKTANKLREVNKQTQIERISKLIY